MTSEDANGAPEGERPKIAEKVKFWEEQDRINQELIPRVLKQHELLASHIKSHESSSVNMASLEARMLEAISAASQQSAEKVSEQVVSLEIRMAEAIDLARKQSAQESAEQVASLEERMTEAVGSARRLAWFVSGVSLVAAAIAILLALAA